MEKVSTCLRSNNVVHLGWIPPRVPRVSRLFCIRYDKLFSLSLFDPLCGNYSFRWLFLWFTVLDTVLSFFIIIVSYYSFGFGLCFSLGFSFVEKYNSMYFCEFCCYSSLLFQAASRLLNGNRRENTLLFECRLVFSIDTAMSKNFTEAFDDFDSYNCCQRTWASGVSLSRANSSSKQIVVIVLTKWWHPIRLKQSN